MIGLPPSTSFFSGNKRFCRFTEQIVLFGLLILKRTFKSYFIFFEYSLHSILLISFGNVQKLTLGGNTLGNLSSMFQYKNLFYVGCVCVYKCVSFWNKMLTFKFLFYFSISFGSSETNMNKNKKLVRDKVCINYFWKKIKVNATITSLIVKIFLIWFILTFY